MAEPFSGDHWGSGFDEEVQEGWTDSESDDEDEEVLTPSRKVLRIQRASTGFREPEEVEDHGEDRMRAALEVLREFARGAYWRDGGLYVERMQEGLQGWRQITTGTNAMSLALALDASSRQSRRKVRLIL